MNKTKSMLLSVTIGVLLLLFAGCKKKEEGKVTVTTKSVAEITANSAKCGGKVTLTGNAEVGVCGVCWSESPSPTINDFFTTDIVGAGEYISTMNSLKQNTKYFVRAYATLNSVVMYGEEMDFTTLSDGGGNGGGGDNGGGNGGGTYNGHEYVDLGLPSGTLWATCNVGANTPDEHGDYFAWGETTPKTTYNWSTYKYCNGGNGWNTLTKYCSVSEEGYNGFTDNLVILLPEDDAATANWGIGWCMPTVDQWEELLGNTVTTWTIQNEVNGRLFTASNGNSLFLPAAGVCGEDEDGVHGLHEFGNLGIYWLNSLSYGGSYAMYFIFNSNGCRMDDYPRDFGLSIRPVRPAR